MPRSRSELAGQHESESRLQRRVARIAEHQCGSGEDTYRLTASYTPPANTVGMQVEFADEMNPQRSVYVVVTCRPGALGNASRHGNTPVVQLFWEYTALSPDSDPLEPSAVSVVAPSGTSYRFPPSGVRRFEIEEPNLPFHPERVSIDVQPDYPSVGDPDRALGFFQLRPFEDVEQARITAAAHGANLLVEIPRDRVFYAFRISRAYPSSREAVAELPLPAAYRAEGPLETGDLSDAAPAYSYTLQRGRCYWIATALDSDAHLSSWNVHLQREWSGRYIALYGEDHRRNFHSTGRAFGVYFGCPLKESEVALRVDFRDAGEAGGYTVQLYSRRATAHEQRDMTRHERREACSHCREERAACLHHAGVTESLCSTLLRERPPTRIGGISADGTSI